jgi:hypothetical protein
MLKKPGQDFQDLIKDKIILSVFIFSSWLIPLSATLLLGMRNPLGIAQAVIVYNVLGIPVIVILSILRKCSFNQAEEVEIKREDDILLQATAFSQSALWIYLNIVPSNYFFSVMKWFVPSIAIMFYVMRAYGKLKNSNIWRFRSIFPLIVAFTSSVSVVIWALTWDNLWKYLFLIDGFDLRGLLFSYLIICPILAAYIIQTNLKQRYGLPVKAHSKQEANQFGLLGEQ